MLKEIHEQVHNNIKAKNEKYQKKANKGLKEHRKFKEGDLVWLHLRKDRFPTQRRNKLFPRVAGPFKILQKIEENDYKLDLPADYGISNTFNIGDLAKYQGENIEQQELRTILSKEGGDDRSIGSCSTIQAQDLTNLTDLSAKEDLTAILHETSTTGARRILHIIHLN